MTRWNRWRSGTLRDQPKAAKRRSSERIWDRYLISGIVAPVKRAEDLPLPLFDTPAAPPAKHDDNLEGEFPAVEELGIEGVGRGNPSGDDGPTELSAPMFKAVYPELCCPLNSSASAARSKREYERLAVLKRSRWST